MHVHCKGLRLTSELRCGSAAKLTANRPIRCVVAYIDRIPGLHETPTPDQRAAVCPSYRPKVQRLTRIVPDLDLAQLVDRDVGVLDTEPGVAIRNLVLLVEAFPGKEVAAIVQRSPRLLYAADLPTRLERCLELLTRLHPARERKVVAPVVAEYPDLLYRMDYYTHVRMIDELPIEIQNMFVLADQGIGFLHRYYKRAKNNFVADTSDEEAGF